MSLRFFNFRKVRETKPNPQSLWQLPFGKGEPYRENVLLLERIKASIFRRKYA